MPAIIALFIMIISSHQHLIAAANDEQPQQTTVHHTTPEHLRGVFVITHKITNTEPQKIKRYEIGRMTATTYANDKVELTLDKVYEYHYTGNYICYIISFKETPVMICIDSTKTGKRFTIGESPQKNKRYLGTIER